MKAIMMLGAAFPPWSEACEVRLARSVAFEFD